MEKNISNENAFKHFSIIFIGPNGEVGSLDGGSTEEESIETGGVVDMIIGKQRHPTEDKFINGSAVDFHPSQYSVVKEYFPPSPLAINDQGEMYLGELKWKPSDVDKIFEKGTIVINR